MPLPPAAARRRPSPRAVHLAAGLGAVLFMAVGTVLNSRGHGEPLPRTLLGWALTATGCAALLWRRRRPVPVAALVLLCTAVYFAVSAYDLPLLLLAYAVALYTVAAEGRLVPAVVLAAVTMLAVAYGEDAGPGQRHVDDASMFLLAGWFVGLIAVGHAQRTRQAYLKEVERRVLAAEREKEVRARQSATEERLRIARELHDVLGHDLSMINVQASAAVHRHAKRPRDAGELLPALEAIRDCSKDALRELRATLGVLRQVDGPEEGAPVAPAGGLERIGELAERARAAGLDVRTETEGTVRDVPPQVSLAAYRIAQESLTNVARHAGARTAVVTVAYDEAGIRVRVEDDGRGAPPGGAAGSGIDGMKERARALGGELTATGTSTGFRVTARLPTGMPDTGTSGTGASNTSTSGTGAPHAADTSHSESAPGTGSPPPRPPARHGAAPARPRPRAPTAEGAVHDPRRTGRRPEPGAGGVPFHPRR
ncbi:sensor histidine kinase [Streptomyces sp. NRRL F-5755]|uniref:sensor histidine kinase n=1 Tax=Streptomyces sp. NRRL F-5755 TaxID=1519475 RepID=UPI0007C6DB89|nr:sensor histidine kinase [Streptomyces sp. NRRL F-5755]